MSQPTIVSCVLTGGAGTTGASPHVAVTPEQLGEEALAVRATIVHIHVRKPATGEPSRDAAMYREMVQRIRASASDVLINLTTGAGGRFMPSADHSNRNKINRGFAGPEERIQHMPELKPDICSLDVGTMNFGSHAFFNPPEHVEPMARATRAAGVKPELKVFDLGHAACTRHLCEKGFFTVPPLSADLTSARTAASRSADAQLPARTNR